MGVIGSRRGRSPVVALKAKGRVGVVTAMDSRVKTAL